MKKKTILITLMLITATVFISACGNKPEPTPTIDPSVVMTQVAGTVQAEITQNALLTPSATVPPVPTATLALPTQALPAVPTTSTLPLAPTVPANLLPDQAKFVTDIDVQDGDVFWQGERFTKTWQFENTGTTTWDTTYRFIYLSGDIMSDELVFNLTTPVKPGELLNISVKMTAPNVIGSYTNWWSLHNGTQFFGDQVNATIVVGTEFDKTATPAG